MSLATIFSDLLMSLTPDAGCYTLRIENMLAAGAVEEAHVIRADDIEVVVQVNHRLDGDKAEEITILPPEGWWAEPSQFTLADFDTIDVLICGEAGA